MSEIRIWLEQAGLGEYGDIFTENDIECDLLDELTDNDLAALGLSLGHRRRFLKALKRAPTPAGEPEAGDGPGQAAERRLLSVMFCDMVGSTDLSQRLDPEDLSDVMRRYQDAVAGAIVRYQGHVAKFLGDGVLAYFGWPQAYEDQAERAIRAGLDAIKAVRGLATPEGQRLDARVGVASGEVVIGDIMGQMSVDTDAVIGETPNLAARLQDAAGAGGLLIGGTTSRLIGRAFILENLGELALKGFSRPVEALRVLGEARTESRFDAAGHDSTTPFVGRTRDLARMQSAWDQARTGRGQVVFIAGEAGIGKSRLIQTFTDRSGDGPRQVLNYQCSPFHTNTALYPIVLHMRQTAGLDLELSEEHQLDRIAEVYGGGEDDNEVALVANLLGVPYEQRYGALNLAPEQLRARLLNSLLERLAGLARRRPVLFLFEDAHWIDPTTAELLALTANHIRGIPILMLLTHRPNWQPGFEAGDNRSRIDLERLNAEDTLALVHSVSGETIPDNVALKITARADGVPLFLEELTKSLVEHGGGELSAATEIPETLQASLLARLDRLGDAKQIAQLGAAIGREFSFAQLAAATGEAEAALARAIEPLLRSELVFQTGEPPAARYRFKHALIQDTAYHSMLTRDRQELHGRIYQSLPAWPEPAAPAVKAIHAERAGEPLKAIEHLRVAGLNAIRTSANAEALAGLESALRLNDELPAGPEHDRRNLEIRVAMGPPLIALRGYPATAVEENYLTALTLAEALKDNDAEFVIRRGLWNCYFDRGSNAEAKRLAQGLLEQADAADDQVKRAAALRAAGSTSTLIGEWDIAEDYLRRGIAAAEAGREQDLRSTIGEDPGIVCKQYLGWTLACTGRIDAGVEMMAATVREAEELEHPIAVAFAQAMQTIVQSSIGNAREAGDIARRTADLARDNYLVFWDANNRINQGWALAVSGEDPGNQGLAQLQEGIAAWRETRAGILMPLWLWQLAHAYLANDRLEEARKALLEASGWMQTNGELWLQAEITRMEARLELASGHGDLGLQLLHKAIAQAQQSGSRTFELFACGNLAAELHKRGESDLARARLAPILAEFDGQSQSTILTEARALLAGLDD